MIIDKINYEYYSTESCLYDDAMPLLSRLME